ncbi:MAG: hypothetical protein J7D61_07855 [Marichromatium sp.]|nr:hypothetical protein [Marichromatium sp.]
MRKLIVDADGIIYHHASIHETELVSEEESEDGLPLYISLYVCPDEVLQAFWADIQALKQKWKADEVVVAITDSARNYRLDIDPAYKGNRKHTRKPLAVRTIRAHLADDERVVFKPRLEADDVIGILMTMRKHRKDEMICWSPDKDLRTIPGIHVNIKEDTLETVTEEEADRFHLLQALAGDSVDGVPGIPGIGMARAQRWLEQHGWTWEAAVALAESKDLDEEYLLRQARLVRILRATDYDFKARRPILWTPPIAQAA